MRRRAPYGAAAGFVNRAVCRSVRRCPASPASSGQVRCVHKVSALRCILRYFTYLCHEWTKVTIGPKIVMHRTLRKIAGIFLVALFVSYYCECTLFVHTHYFIWGKVTHSHPFLPSADGHSHTEAECQTIASLSHIVVESFAGMSVTLTVLFVLTAVMLVPPVHSLARHIRCNRTLRAPPAVIC